MPYKSAKQRAYLHIHEPALAKKWDKETGGKVVPSKSPPRKETQVYRGVMKRGKGA